MLKVSNITKYYGDFLAVDNLSFTVKPGEIFGLLGVNGSGKTTTFRMIMGLLEPSSGSITLNGKPIDYSVTDQIGFLTEERSLLLKMTVKEQCIFYGILKGMTEEERKAAVKELDQAEQHFTRQLQNQKNVKEGALGAVKGIELSRLKSAPLVDATKSADKVLETAGKEVIGMLMEEAKEHVEAEQEEKIKEAEDKKEKEKELEEKIEAMKAKKEEKKESSENPELEAIEENTAHLLKTMQVKDDVQKQLQGVVKQMKLSLEDIKGAAVDEKV